MRFGDNPNVSGTLLISDGVVAGADIPGNGNPYARFASLRPAAVIDRGVYVYQGPFNLGPAAALEHIHAAQDFSAKHDVSGTVREARIAERLDPNNPEVHAILGDTFAAAGDTTAARAEYSAALHSSELDPVFQKGLLAQLQAKTKR
jgi:thioredoxin-like negative regulator of GroEL